MIILELLTILFLPAGILWLTSKIPSLKIAGPIAICYIFGFIFSLMPIAYDKDLSKLTASIIVAIAIPLILFGFDLRAVRYLAKDVLKGYGLQIAATVLCTVAVTLIAGRAGLAYGSQLAGMAAGVYTGGTPNLIAVGNALVTGPDKAEIITSANTADFIIGGVYFFLILTIVGPIYRRFLGEKEQPEDNTADDHDMQSITAGNEYDYRSIPRDGKSLARLISVTLLAVVCLAAGAALEFLINGNLDGSLYIMITVSILGIAGSLIRPVRETKGTYQVGQYLVLMFSLGLSMSIDLSVLASTIMQTFVYFACVHVTCTAVHLLLCKLSGIDGGTALITNAAGIYGPPFIAPVAESYGRRQLIAPGVICGVTGLVIGNFIGISIGTILYRLTAI